jgi:hypothetical protein
MLLGAALSVVEGLKRANDYLGVLAGIRDSGFGIEDRGLGIRD